MCKDCGTTWWYGGMGPSDFKPIDRSNYPWPPAPAWPVWVAQPPSGMRFFFKKKPDMAMRVWPSGKTDYGPLSNVITQPKE